MFSKTADPTSAPAAPPVPRPQGSTNASRSILGPDLKITGEISSAGTVDVMGEIDGNISADVLTIGAEGRVSGSVHATTLEVKGRLDGKVDSDSFTLRASAQVKADITYRAVVIESGALIEGRFQRPKA